MRNVKALVLLMLVALGGTAFARYRPAYWEDSGRLLEIDRQWMGPAGYITIQGDYEYKVTQSLTLGKRNEFSANPPAGRINLASAPQITTIWFDAAQANIEFTVCGWSTTNACVGGGAGIYLPEDKILILRRVDDSPNTVTVNVCGGNGGPQGDRGVGSGGTAIGDAGKNAWKHGRGMGGLFVFDGIRLNAEAGVPGTESGVKTAGLSANIGGSGSGGTDPGEHRHTWARATGGGGYANAAYASPSEYAAAVASYSATDATNNITYGRFPAFGRVIELDALDGNASLDANSRYTLVIDKKIAPTPVAVPRAAGKFFAGYYGNTSGICVFDRYGDPVANPGANDDKLIARWKTSAHPVGFEVKLGLTGEAESVLSDAVTPGAEMAFQYTGDENMKPIAWTVNGEARPLPADGVFSFVVTTNTSVFITCRRPVYVSNGVRPWTANAAFADYGYTKANPCRTLQEGVDRATEGSPVYVLSPGVYAPFTATNGVHVSTVEMSDGEAVIDGGGTNRCVTLAEGASVRGFTLYNGRADRGAGAYGGTVRQCVISNCVATAEGGGACSNALHYCLIVGCQAKAGGGASGSQLFNCTVASCQAETGGGLNGGTAANSLVVRCTPESWLGLEAKVASFDRSTICFSKTYPYHLDTRFEYEGVAVPSLVFEQEDLEGVELPATGINPGCYQKIVPSVLTGVTVGGVDLAESPSVIWDVATQTATLSASDETLVVGGSNTTVTLVSPSLTPVVFDGLVYLQAISNLTVKGGTLDAAHGWDCRISGGSVRCEGAFRSSDGSVATLRTIELDVPHGVAIPLHEIAGQNSGYGLDGVLSNEGKVYFWLADDFEAKYYMLTDKGFCFVLARADILTNGVENCGLTINGEDLFRLNGDGWTFDHETRRVRLTQGRTYAILGTLVNEVADVFGDIQFEVTVAGAGVTLGDNTALATKTAGVSPLVFTGEGEVSLAFATNVSVTAVSAPAVSVGPSTTLVIDAVPGVDARLQLDGGSRPSIGGIGGVPAGTVRINGRTVVMAACAGGSVDCSVLELDTLDFIPSVSTDCVVKNAAGVALNRVNVALPEGAVAGGTVVRVSGLAGYEAVDLLPVDDCLSLRLPADDKVHFSVWAGDVGIGSYAVTPGSETDAVALRTCSTWLDLVAAVTNRADACLVADIVQDGGTLKFPQVNADRFQILDLNGHKITQTGLYLFVVSGTDAVRPKFRLIDTSPGKSGLVERTTPQLASIAAGERSSLVTARCADVELAGGTFVSTAQGDTNLLMRLALAQRSAKMTFCGTNFRDCQKIDRAFAAEGGTLIFADDCGVFTGIRAGGKNEVAVDRLIHSGMAEATAGAIWLYGGVFVGNDTNLVIKADSGCAINIKGGVFDFAPGYIDTSEGLVDHVIEGTSLHVVGKYVASRNGELTDGVFGFNPSEEKYRAAGVKIASGKRVTVSQVSPYSINMAAISYRIVDDVPEHRHCLCGHSACEAHSDVIEWQPTAALPNVAGNYYLTNDVVMTGRWFPGSGETRLCLNGHTVKVLEDMYSIELHQATLTISDCQSGRGKIVGSCGDWYPIYVLTGATLNLYGGTIDLVNTASAVAASCHVLSCDGGRFNMYGGTIYNDPNEKYDNQAIAMANAGECRIYGGVLMRRSRTYSDYFDVSRSSLAVPLQVYGGMIAGGRTSSWNDSLVSPCGQIETLTEYRSPDTGENADTEWNVAGENPAGDYNGRLTSGIYSFDPRDPEYAAFGLRTDGVCVLYLGKSGEPARDRWRVSISQNVTVNGDGIDGGSGRGWTYADNVLTLDGSVDYAIFSPARSGLKVVAAAPSKLTGGTLYAQEMTGTFVVTGGNFKANVLTNATFLDGSAQARPAYPADIYVGDFIADGKSVLVKGLSDYGVDNLVPIGGWLRFWLPEGGYSVDIGAYRYVITVAADGTVEVGSVGVRLSTLLVNGAVVDVGTTGAGWVFNNGKLWLDGTADQYRISGVDSNVTVIAESGFSSVTLESGAGVGTLSVASHAVLALTCAGNATVWSGALSVATNGVLRLERGTARLPAVTGEGALEISGGCWTFAGDAWRRATNEGLPVRQLVFEPAGARSSAAVAVTGLMSYDTKDLYAIDGALHLYPSEDETLLRVAYETANGTWQRYLREASGRLSEIVYDYTVNGTDIGRVEGPGWSFDALGPIPTVTLTGTNSYVIVSTGRVDVAIESTGESHLTDGTLVYPTNAAYAVEGDVRLCGGNLMIDRNQFAAQPRNLWTKVYPLDLRLLTQGPAGRIVKVTGVPDGYATDYATPIDGCLRLWLPKDRYDLTVEGVCYEAVVDEEGSTVHLPATGLKVDDTDICALSGDGWTWSPVTGELKIDGAHRIDGTNVLDRVTIVGGESFELTGGTLRFADDVRGRLVITGGNVLLRDNLTAVPSNLTARVWHVTLPVPTAMAASNTVTVLPLTDYAADNLVPIDGKLHLWLADGDYRVMVGCVRMDFTVEGSNVTTKVVEQGFAVDGKNIGEAVGDGWTYFAPLGELLLTSSSEKTLAGVEDAWEELPFLDEELPYLNIVAQASQTLVLSNVTYSSEGGDVPAIEVPANCALTLRNIDCPAVIAAGATEGAVAGGGAVTFAGGSFDLTGGVAVTNVTILGGCIRCDAFASTPVNAKGEALHCLRVPLSDRVAAPIDEDVTVEGLPDGYDCDSLRAVDGILYLWLPDGPYALTVNGDPFVALMAGTNMTATVTEDLSPVGVTVNGIDCGLLYDTGWTYDRESKVLTVTATDTVVIAGTNTAGDVRVLLAGNGADVRFDNLALTGGGTNGLVCLAPGVSNRVAFAGACSLVSTNGPAIRVAKGAQLGLGISDYSLSLLDYEYWYGELTAVGGEGAAAIGGGKGESAGEIVFHSGSYDLTGGARAAAVGGGDKGDGGTVRTESSSSIAWLQVTAVGGEGFDATGGAAIGGGYQGSGGTVSVSYGLFDLSGGDGAAAVGGGGAGDAGKTFVSGGTLIVRPGEVREDVVRPTAIGGGAAGVTQRSGVNVFTGGSVVIPDGTSQVLHPPSNGVTEVHQVVLTLPDGLVERKGCVGLWFDKGLDDYGTDDIYAVDGTLTLWLPDGTHSFAVKGVSMSVTVENGEAGPLVYPETGVTVDGRDCNVFSGPGWTWSVARRELTVGGIGTHVISGRVTDGADGMRLVLTNDASVVLSNYFGATEYEPFYMAEGTTARVRNVGAAARYARLAGPGACVFVGGTLTFDGVSSKTSVLIGGGSVFLPTGEVHEVRAPDGSGRIWPVRIKLSTLCVADTAVEIEGLPDSYDVSNIRAVSREICVWLPEGAYPVDVSGYDAQGERRSRTLLVTVGADGTADVPEIPFDVVIGDRGESLAVPRDWVDAYGLVKAGGSSDDYQAALHAPSKNKGGSGETNLPVWKSYAAGLNPTNETESFYAVIEPLANGLFQVRPNVVRDGRVYKVVASKTLDFEDVKLYPINRDGLVVPDPEYQFFKVKVGFE